MTSTIQIHKPASVSVAAATVDVTGGMSFADMVTMGDQLVRTGFLPEHIKNGVQFAAIVLDGRERGMLPMRAIRALQMVKGKVCESADSQLARFKADGGHASFTRLDDDGAVLWLRHPNGDEHTETWGPEDSKKAGLAGGMHGKFPRAMFRSRAITAGLKSVGWEGSVGTYDPAELDMAEIGEPVRPPLREVNEPPDDSAARMREARKGIVAECARLGVESMHIASRLSMLNDGKQPVSVDEYERCLARLQLQSVPGVEGAPAEPAKPVVLTPASVADELLLQAARSMPAWDHDDASRADAKKKMRAHCAAAKKELGEEAHARLVLVAQWRLDESPDGQDRGAQKDMIDKVNAAGGFIVTGAA